MVAEISGVGSPSMVTVPLPSPAPSIFRVMGNIGVVQPATPTSTGVSSRGGRGSGVPQGDCEPRMCCGRDTAGTPTAAGAGSAGRAGQAGGVDTGADGSHAGAGTFCATASGRSC